jgi:ribosome biogenesis protein ERB1
MVHAIKMGWMKPTPKASDEPNFYMLWESDDKAEEMRRVHDHIPAPKIRMPANAESYNPPAEYLFDEREVRTIKYNYWTFFLKVQNLMECR